MRAHPHTCRQSRFLKLDSAGYHLYTVDHEDRGRLRLDLAAGWQDTEAPQVSRRAAGCQAPLMPARLLCCGRGATMPVAQLVGAVWWQGSSYILVDSSVAVVC